MLIQTNTEFLLNASNFVQCRAVIELRLVFQTHTAKSKIIRVERYFTCGPFLIESVFLDYSVVKPHYPVALLCGLMSVFSISRPDSRGPCGSTWHGVHFYLF
jgi:hypothetical protein